MRKCLYRVPLTDKKENVFPNLYKYIYLIFILILSYRQEDASGDMGVGAGGGGGKVCSLLRKKLLVLLVHFIFNGESC